MHIYRVLVPLLAVSALYVSCSEISPNYSCTFHIERLKPKGFRIILTDARDIRQLHIFWNFRKPYNRSNPYSSTDFTNVSFNENFDKYITVTDNDIQLRVGDSIFYWLLLVTKEWERITLHKQNFYVKFDEKTWDSVPESFAETYYRDFDNFFKDEL